MTRSAIAIAAFLLFAAGAANGQDHPYAGLWGEAGAADVKADPTFFGAHACFNKFTEQQPDGRFRYFLVDHAKWIKERKIEYLLAQEGTCTADATGRTEKCTGKVIGERDSDWYFAYDKTEGGNIQATYYENVFYFEKRVNGERVVRQTCPFDLSKIKPYITGRTIADCSERCRAFGKTEAAQLADMVAAMQKP